MEDVEGTLADLERRLRALQAELAAHEDAPAPATHEDAPAPAGESSPGAVTPTPAPPAGPLDRFADELRSTTARLVASYDRARDAARGAADADLFSDDVALEARADLPALCALASALASIDGVHGVDLRAYAGGHAALDVGLDRPVALVAELRRAGAPNFGVVEARPGRLAIEVGARGRARTPPPG